MGNSVHTFSDLQSLGLMLKLECEACFFSEPVSENLASHLPQILFSVLLCLH